MNDCSAWTDNDVIAVCLISAGIGAALAILAGLCLLAILSWTDKRDQPAAEAP